MRLRALTIICIISIFLCSISRIRCAPSMVNVILAKPLPDEFDEENTLKYRVVQSLADIAKEAIEFHTKLFRMESLQVTTVFAPWYMNARTVDPHLHNVFYDKTQHKNIRQPHPMLRTVIEKSVFYTLIGLSSLAFVAPDEDLRTTSRIFAIGGMCGLMTKNLLKRFHFEGNLRPWHEQFSPRERAHGGFPSGHVFQAVYMTAVYGLQYGLKAILPLGLFSSTIFGMSIASNRHYASQVVAGAAFGLIYGLAADALIQNKCMAAPKGLEFSVSQYGLPSVRMAYYF